MFDLKSVQEAVREAGVDGWLLYDFRGLNEPARRVLDISPKGHLTRRWFYFVPASGEPRKLQHRIEPHSLAHLPGSATSYLRWQELEANVAALVAGCRRVAMEYVPRNANPYVSRVDAGTVELVRSCGVEIVPSGDLVQRFEACWSDEQWKMHRAAAVHTRAAYDVATRFLAGRVRGGGTARETEVQDVILRHFKDNGLVTDSAPIVGVGPHSGDPHYEPKEGSDAAVGAGDFVLIDLWAKLDPEKHPNSVYSDLTRVYFLGASVPDKYENVFQIVANARDAAIRRVRDAFASGEDLRGWQVDRAAREVIDKAGYGEAFCHRTGHSIGQETHGNGANMDDLETHEERRVLPRTCFSVEPGIYLKEFGVRSEVNVFVDAGRKVHVTGGDPQTRVEPLLP
jgi:Xaa-Pro aminopeptidase